MTGLDPGGLTATTGLKGTSSEDGHDSVRSALIDSAARLAERRIAEETNLRAGLLPFAWVSPEDVASVAGCSTEVFDELWAPLISPDGTQIASPFEAFLLETLSEFPGSIVKAYTLDAIAEDMADIDDLIRIAAVGEPFDPETMFLYLTSLAVSAYSLRFRHDFDHYITDVAAILELGLTGFGFNMRPGLTWRHLALPVAAALEGPWMYTVFGVKDPNPTIRFRITPDAKEQDWTLDSIAAWSAIQAMTQPPGSGPESW